MRLGPTPTARAPLDRPRAGAPPPARRWRGTGHVGLGARANQGGFGAGPRVAVGAGVAIDRLEAMLVVDLGTEVAIATSGAAMWSQLVLAARVGRRFDLPGLWVRPLVGLATIRARARDAHPVTGRTIEQITYTGGLDGAVEVGVTRTRWSATATLGLTAVPWAQELRGQLQLRVDARVEPWAQLGARVQFP